MKKVLHQMVDRGFFPFKMVTSCFHFIIMPLVSYRGPDIGLFRDQCKPLPRMSYIPSGIQHPLIIYAAGSYDPSFVKSRSVSPAIHIPGGDRWN